jgi:hypothetical protein
MLKNSVRIKRTSFKITINGRLQLLETNNELLEMVVFVSILNAGDSFEADDCPRLHC